MIRYDILICGIGGQGVISLGTSLKLAAIEDGLTVVGAEKRGGAQREGVVVSNVRYLGLEEGECFDDRNMAVSGLIPNASVDMMIAMEPLEALRHAAYLHEDSIVIINNFPLIPVAVRIGEYEDLDRDEIFSRVREFSKNVHIYNINEIAIGNFKSLRQVNTISLGLAFSLGNMPISEKSLIKTLKDQFSEFEINKLAFELGVRIAGKY